MDLTELKKKIDIVFKQELNCLEREQVTFRFVKTGERFKGGYIANFNLLIETEPEKYTIDYPSMGTLKKLYLSIETNPQLKKYFIEELINIFHIDTYETYDINILPLATLIYTNNANDALNILFLITKDDKLYSLLGFLKIFLRCNYHYLNNQQLNSLRDYLSKPRSKLFNMNIETKYIIQQIDKISFDNLNKELEGINFEINQDEEKVIEKAEYYKFDKEIVEALREIDKFIYLESSKTISSGMVKNFREMFATLVENICNKIKEITKEEYPEEAETKIGNLRIYLKKHLQLSNRENSFINKFIDLLHQEGGHSFMSDKEYFRLARNIFIIIAYFLLTKLDKVTTKV